MKRDAILGVLAGLLFVMQAAAQTTPPPATGSMNGRELLAGTTPEQRAGRQTAQMKQRLSLTPDQETAVAAINLKYAQQTQSLLESGARNRNTLKQARGITNSKNDELEKVFDKDQYKQYKVFRDEQKDRMKQARGGRRNR